MVGQRRVRKYLLERQLRRFVRAGSEEMRFERSTRDVQCHGYLGTRPTLSLRLRRRRRMCG